MASHRSFVTAARRVVDVAIVVLIVLVAFGVVLGRGVPMSGRQTLIIGGGSMEPAIPLGAAIIIDPVAPADIAVGDVVTMKVGVRQSVFTHRVTRLLTLDGVPYIATKGDANSAPDGASIPAAAVIGRVAWSIPLAGFLLALLSVPIGVLFVLGLGVTLALLAFLLDTIESAGAPRPAAVPASRPATARRAARRAT
jgi:signal peptidase